MSNPSSRRRLMTLAQPAARWQDALPVGNGRLGAMVYGGIASERILLNHKHLWVPRPKPVLPDVSAHLPDLRALLTEGRWPQAATFLQTRLQEAGYPLARPGAYQPAGELLIWTQTSGAFTRYGRAVDFETAVATVSWSDDAGDFKREVFVSHTRDIVAVRLTTSQPGTISCRLQLAPHDSPQIPTVSADVGSDPGLTFQSAAQDAAMTLVGTFSDSSNFGTAARVIVQGADTARDGAAVTIRNANSVVVLMTLFVFEDPQTALPAMADDLAACDYASLLAEHLAAHAEVFNRTTIDIADAPATDTTNEQLLLDGYNGSVGCELIQRMIDFGRHALICSSGPDTWPANLQGIWNGHYAPPWRSDYHNDENIQMNYWQALPGNLPEAATAMFDYFEQFLDDFRTNARCLYGTRGIYIPIAMTTHGHPGPGGWCNWTAAAGWLAQHFYDYVLFTGDRTFLADRAVPFMKEVAEFYEDFLHPGPDGRWVFSPSLSPENAPQGEGFCSILVNATMDVAIARELLSNLCDACELLGIDAEGVVRWRTMLEKLPDYSMNDDGAIAEWIDPRLPDNYHHRHQSHIYPLFPGIEITQETDPDLYEACRMAVEKRLVVGLTSQTGWSLAHMANVYARLGDGDRALQCMEYITRACTGPNLLTYHNDWRGQGLTLGYAGQPPIFQIDANMGLTAAAMEMLVFSRPGLVKLLPALPAKWPRGSTTGIRCRGCLTASLQWDVPTGHFEATLTSDQDQTVTVKLPPGATLTSCDIASGASSLGEGYLEIDLPAGKAVPLTAVIAPGNR